MSRAQENKTDVEQKGFSFFLIIMFAITELIIIGVLAMELNSNYSEKEEKEKSYINKNLITFDMLPREIKQLYTLKKSKGVLNGSDTSVSDANNIDYRESYTQYIDKDKIIFLSEVTCQDMFLGSFQLSSNCHNALREFFQDKNENMIFEVVPLVQSSDLIDLGRVVNMLTQNEYEKYYLDKDIINNFTQYTRDGLAQNRIQQGIIQIKAQIGNKTKIRMSPFYKFSDKKSGFIIKAYNVL